MYLLVCWFGFVGGIDVEISEHDLLFQGELDDQFLLGESRHKLRALFLD